MEAYDLSGFDISADTLAKLEAAGIKNLYKVQAETFDHIKNGDDVVTLAKTGSGKTLAFSIPLIELIKEKGLQYKHGRHPVAIILAPTRELATQTVSVLNSLVPDKIRVLAVYGGVPYQGQISALRAGVDIIVGAPGRIIDLMSTDRLQLDNIQYVVLDEVDRMLDMGFSVDVEKILTSVYVDGRKPQTLLFSATMPQWVSKISKRYISPDCKRITLISNQEARTADTVEHFAILCPFHERAHTLADVIRVYSKGPSARCIVFCETKKDADELAGHSAMSNDCHVFHGDIPQDKREFILQKFREGKYKILITTNVAARGLDIADVDLVIQCAPPPTSEDYIHRSGRTGRAGRSGTSICFYTMKQRHQLAFIERGAGIVFKRISAPSPDDIVDVWTSELLEVFSEIPESTWSTFLPAARRLIKAMDTQTEDESPEQSEKKTPRKVEENGAINSEDLVNGHIRDSVPAYQKALCCALAKIAGKLKTIESRSLLSAHADLTAFRLDIPSHITAQRKGLCYSILSRQLSVEITEAIRNLAFIKGRKGFVFDVPTDKVDELESAWANEDSGVVLEKLTELPELEPDEGGVSGGGGGNAFRFGASRGGPNNGRGRRGFGRAGGRGGRNFGGRRGGFSGEGRGFRGGMKRPRDSSSGRMWPSKVQKLS